MFSIFLFYQYSLGVILTLKDIQCKTVKYDSYFRDITLGTASILEFPLPQKNGQEFCNNFELFVQCVVKTIKCCYVRYITCIRVFLLI